MTTASKPNPRRAQRGSVLFAALAVVLTVTVLASCLLQISAVTANEQTQSIDRKRAFYIAESGLSEAWYGLRTGKNGNVGTAELPAAYGDGVLWVEAESIGGGMVNLVSTGLCGSGRFSLSMVVQQDASAVGGLGFFADQDVSIGPGVLIDSFDSNLGPYQDPAPPAAFGEAPPTTSKIASNGDITLTGSPSITTVVKGDVQPGPTGSVLIGDLVTISGSTAPAAKPVTLPEIEVPAIASSGDLRVGGKLAISELPTGESHYGLLEVQSGSTLTINGPATVVAEDLIVAPGAAVVINASLGAVTIYATGSLVWSDGSALTCIHEDPTQLSLQVSAQVWVDRDGDGDDDPPAVFRPSGAFHGALYAPHSPIAVGATTEIFGAVAAESLILEDDARLHFDAAFLSLTSGGAGGYSVAGWRVVELPDVPLVNKKLDPLHQLKMDGVEIPLASDAHETVLFKIRYIDSGGKTIFWSGDEAKFDWAQVSTTLEVAREGDPNFLTI